MLLKEATRSSLLKILHRDITGSCYRRYTMKTSLKEVARSSLLKLLLKILQGVNS